MKKLSKLLAVIIMSMVFASAIASASAVSVTIGSLSGGFGVTSGGIWVGNFPITISGSTPPQTLAYCLNFHGVVYVGSTYTANLASPPDNALWKSIGYILTWHDPAGDNNAAAANAIAFWKLVDPSVDLSAISETLRSAGAALITESVGRDVVRQGDVLHWVSPAIPNEGVVYANPAQTITFTAKVTSSGGVARPGVKLLFNAIVVSSGASVIVNPASAFTDSSGQATVTVTVPLGIPQGSSIKVTASSKGVWPQLYLDLTTGNTNNLQDLIGLDTSYSLTLTTEVAVRANVFVLPESPLGALSAVGASVLAFGCFAVLRKKRQKI